MGPLGKDSIIGLPLKVLAYGIYDFGFRASGLQGAGCSVQGVWSKMLLVVGTDFGK